MCSHGRLSSDFWLRGGRRKIQTKNRYQKNSFYKQARPRWWEGCAGMVKKNFKGHGFLYIHYAFFKLIMVLDHSNYD